MSTVNLDSATSTAQKFGRWSLGMGTPAQQILATTIVGVALILSSSVSFGATLVLVPVAALWWVVGWFRLVPGVESFWPL